MTVIGRTRTETIAKLNDRVRLGIDRNAKVVITRSCLDTFSDGNFAQAIVHQALIMRDVAHFKFGVDDTHRERDFGAFTYRGQKLFFKIDYFDLALDYGSEDPSDASQTRRVMTIMLASDY